jgi:ribose transport system ATP-binding protein
MDGAMTEANGHPAQGEVVLDVRNVTKAYGPTVALRDVSIQVRRGEVHALLGENGAGKSTLVKILSGVVDPDSGSIGLGGEPYRPKGFTAAQAAGVSTAFQELSLLPNLTVGENLLLPHLPKSVPGVISRRRVIAGARKILGEFGGSDIDPTRVVSTLSLAEKQRVEIIRAISRRPRLLILDEPTAALAEPEWLFDLIGRLSAAGCAILYISHRLGEVRRLCDQSTVLRNGSSIATVKLTGTRDSEIFHLMVGVVPEASQERGDVRVLQTPVPALRVHDLVGQSLRGVSFDLHQGEVLGVAALEGQGQRELLRILAGLDRARAGTVEVQGNPVTLMSPGQALRTGSGIGFVPEERKTEGVFLGMTAEANISLSILDRLTRFGLVDRRKERTRVMAEAMRVDLSDRYLPMPLAALSGGNQQKALIGRVLLSGARTLILFDPTRGVDVGTKQVVHRVIRDFAASGGSALIHSTEIPELVNLCDRVLVIYQGRVAGLLDRSQFSESRLVAMATGHSLEAAE